MHPNSTLYRMLGECVELPDGFLSLSESTSWRLGTVLLARRLDAFAVVRKSPVQGGTYQFAGLYALPGGMVRVHEPAGIQADAAETHLRASLFERVHREAGLTPEQLRDPSPAQLGPIVTSYTAKGQQRFTLIVPFVSVVDVDARLEVCDRSVDESSWMTIPPAWEKMAPGNRVAIAHLIWNELNVDQRAAAWFQVETSVQQCSEWATSIGIVPVPPPWASKVRLTTWNRSWPTAKSE